MRVIFKVLAIILSLSLIISVMPVAVGAEEYTDNGYSEGSDVTEGASVNEEQPEAEPVAEIKELRNENEKHFLMSDRSIQAVVYSQPVHYKVDDEWVDIDNSLVSESASDAEDIDGYCTRDNNVKVKIAKNSHSKKQVSIKSKDYAISWGYADVNRAKKKSVKMVTESQSNSNNIIYDSVSDNTQKVKFNGIADNCDIEYIIAGQSVKENIIVKQPSDSYTYSFDIMVKKLTLNMCEDGSIACVNSNNEVIYQIPAPYMYDSNYEMSDNVTYSLSQKNKNKYVLTVTADSDWVNQAERAFPVTIDPVVESTVDEVLTSARTVSNGTSYTSPLQIGNGKTVIMSYALPQINGAYIKKASLNLFTSSLPNTSIALKEVTKDNGGASYTAAPSITDNLLCSYGSTNSFDVTKLVHNAYYSNKNSISVELSQTTSSNDVTLNNQYINQNRMLVIEYSNFEGIDSDLSYHTFDIGRAGMAYINDIDGNRLISRTDLGVDGNTLPVSVSMVYNKHNIALQQLGETPYGYGWNCNYFYKLEDEALGDCDYSLADASGYKIFFKTEDNTTWTDENGKGYELTFVSPNTKNGAKILTPNNEIFTLDAYGRVIKIENQTFKDNGLTNAIKITFNGAATSSTGNRISSIIDGAGRKYLFVYSSGRLSKINYVGTGSNTIYSVSYSYSKFEYADIYRLSTVTYDDGNSASYQYDAGNYMTKATDADGYNITFSGTNRTIKVAETSGSGTTGGTLNMVYGGNRTIFYDNNDNYEYMYFDTQGNVTSVRDEKGNAVFAEYGGRGELNKISDVKDTNINYINDNNLIKNGDFTVANISTLGSVQLSKLTNWSHCGTNTSDVVTYAAGQTSIPNYDSSRVYINGDSTTAKTISQTISVTDGKAGDQYSFGGWSIGNALPLHEEISNNTRVWGMTLETINSNGTAKQIGKFSYNPYDSSWQYIRSDATATEAYTSLRITIHYTNQANYAYFDGIELVKIGTGESPLDEETEDVTEENTTEDDAEEPTFNSNGIKTYTSTSDDGIISKESVDRYENSISSEISDGTKSIFTSNTYTANGNYTASQTDEAGSKTGYSYDIQRGLLNSATDANNVSTNYTYDSIGNIISSSCGNTTNSYTYDKGRIKSIGTDSQNYYFVYDEWGNQTDIKVGKSESAAVSIIKYVYDTVANGGKLKSLNYGNGQIISYTYDHEDKPTEIKINGTTRYTLQYKYGELKSVTDVLLNIKTVYTEDGVEEYNLNNNRKVYSSYTNGNDEFVEDLYSASFSRKSTQNENGTVTTVDYKNRGTLYAKQTIANDAFGRVTENTVKSGTNSDVTQLKTTYTYRNINASKTTNQISKITYTSGHSSLKGSNAKTISYTYDKLGNISTVSDSSGTTKYYYDDKGQLIRVDDATQNYTFMYNYNSAGNVGTVVKYKFGSASSADIIDTTYYGYDNKWEDELVYNSKCGMATYDAAGNPLIYFGKSLTWTAGRQLETVTGGNDSYSYAYDYNGLRRSKTVNGEKTEYQWSNDGRLLSQTDAYGNKMYFHYDEAGEPIGVNYYGAEYVYLKNAQGDIIGLTIPSGRLVAEYKYDAWGELISVTGSMAEHIGIENPLRYRGYYYDNETGYYYLQSRYYNPEVGRFINADDTDYLGASGTELSYNIFAYCENNPITYVDPKGYYKGQVKYGQYGGIYDPKAYLKDRYGGTISQKESKILSMSNKKMDYFSKKGVCSKVAITRVLHYYSKKYNKIDSNIKNIYKTVRSLDCKDGTDPWYIDDIARNALKKYGYKNSTSWNVYAWAFKSEVKKEIDNNHPVILNIARGYYGDHTVTVIGYKIFVRKKKTGLVTVTKKYPMIAIYDGWDDRIMYIDYNDFAFNFKYAGIGSFTKVRVKK